MANMKHIKEISFKDRDAIFDRLERLASQVNMSKEEYAHNIDMIGRYIMIGSIVWTQSRNKVLKKGLRKDEPKDWLKDMPKG